MGRRCIFGSIWIVCACGPVVSGDDGAAGDDTTTSATTMGTSPSTTLGTGPEPDPTVATSANPTSATTVDPDPSDTTSVVDPTEVDPTCSFGCLPDFGGGEQCDVWSQDCTRGSKCMPWAFDGGAHWNGTKCSALDPNPAQLGDPCTAEDGYMGGVDDCDISMMCMFVDPDTDEGVCVALCMGSEDNAICEDPALGCSIQFSDFMNNCLPACDPLLQDCALGGCYPTADDAFVCGPTIGLGALDGEPCEYHWDCAAGTICVESACATLCDLLDPGTCDGEVCMPWSEDVGVCGG